MLGTLGPYRQVIVRELSANNAIRKTGVWIRDRFNEQAITRDLE